MKGESESIGQRLRTPRAAAVAGIIFSILTVTSHVLIRDSISSHPLGSAVEVVRHAKTLSNGLNLTPFAGITFLWFVAVVRDRLGKLEDRFFSTILFGSGLLYVGMLFVSASLAGGLLRVLSSGTVDLVESGAYAVGRAQINQILSVYEVKMAGMFMISSSTVFLRTRVVPRWVAFLGFALALLLLLSVGVIEWMRLVFPLWVFLVSMCFLIEKFRGPSQAAQDTLKT